MKRFLCTHALLSDGWQSDVLIEVDAQGVIASVQYGVRDVPEKTERLSGLVLPSMVNLHSHAFQRAMAGLAEVAGDPQDSFWTWREQMYHLVSHLSPEQVGVIAAYLYIDMLKGGYTQVAEFNYLHHDKDGKAYQQDEMAIHLINAVGMPVSGKRYCRFYIVTVALADRRHSRCNNALFRIQRLICPGLLSCNSIFQGKHCIMPGFASTHCGRSARLRLSRFCLIHRLIYRFIFILLSR